ncbi:hypothetical protein SEEE3139_08644 [Salmonella enterica subsp. enterica serovar Enteritidis str. 622731-39]|nr:hypothetical protein SEEE3139_08644 [Salmonella enterica subsp. enterica serovar Enteritidis str. 622731-39]
MAMNVELTAEQKIALEALQRKSRDPINEQNRCTTGPELTGGVIRPGALQDRMQSLFIGSVERKLTPGEKGCLKNRLVCTK